MENARRRVTITAAAESPRHRRRRCRGVWRRRRPSRAVSARARSACVRVRSHTMRRRMRANVCVCEKRANVMWRWVCKRPPYTHTHTERCAPPMHVVAMHSVTDALSLALPMSAVGRACVLVGRDDRRRSSRSFYPFCIGVCFLCIGAHIQPRRVCIFDPRDLLAQELQIANVRIMRKYGNFYFSGYPMEFLVFPGNAHFRGHRCGTFCV